MSIDPLEMFNKAVADFGKEEPTQYARLFWAGNNILKCENCGWKYKKKDDMEATLKWGNCCVLCGSFIDFKKEYKRWGWI